MDNLLTNIIDDILLIENRSFEEINLEFFVGKLKSLRFLNCNIKKIISLNKIEINYDIIIDNSEIGTINIENNLIQNLFEIKRTKILKQFFIKKSIIKGNLNFLNSNFKEITFKECEIYNNLLFILNEGKEFNIIDSNYFNNNVYIDFNSSKIDKVKFINIDIEYNFIINFCSTIISFFYIDLKNEDKYNSLILCLLLSNITSFKSDSINIYKIKLGSLFFIDDLLKQFYPNYNSFKKINFQIHEQSLFLQICQNLNIFKGIDYSYCNLMELKLKQMYNDKFKYYFFLIVYSKIFGWGIKFTNIFISTIFILLIFGLIYSIFFVDILIKNKVGALIFSIFSFFDIILPDKDITPLTSNISIFSGIESIMGMFFITIFIAMLTRKFMRI